MSSVVQQYLHRDAHHHHHHEFMRGGTINFVLANRARAVELYERLVDELVRDGAVEDPIHVSSHPHLRAPRRLVTSEGEILIARFKKKRVWIQYERFPAYCVCCHLWDYVLSKLGVCNIGPAGRSYRTAHNPILIKIT